MATMKFEIPLLDRNNKFLLWQVKMRVVLAQIDLDESLLGLDKMSSSLTK